MDTLWKLTRDYVPALPKFCHVIKRIPRELLEDERTCTLCSKEVEWRLFSSHPDYFQYWKYKGTQLSQLFITVQ